MNVVERYKKRIYDMYIQTHPNVNQDKVKFLIDNLTNENLKDIPCEMHNNVKDELYQSTMIKTFDWIDTRQPIITANGTFFKQHDEYLSPKVLFLEDLQQTRDKEKKKMYACKKGTPEYLNHYTEQINTKVCMNADYGGSGTILSPFYSMYLPPATTQSAKIMTTTLICCLEFISDNDNQWAKLNNINDLFDMINVVINTNDDRTFINDNYTPNEVLERLISKTNNLTFEDVKVLSIYLNSLSKEDLSKLMLAFNIRLVLTKYLSSEVELIMNYYKSHPLNINDISEESLYVSGFGVKPPEEIADLLSHVNKVILDNCVYPFMLNDNDIRANEMKRIIVCVTDTDSLMVHFASYIDEFQARTNNFKESCLFASALGMRIFVEAMIPQMVSDIAIYCNIKDPYYRNKFIFKNEFIFLTMALFAKKMYAMSMFCQEGKPRDPHDISVTGLSFKKRDAPEFLEPIMLKLFDEKILTPDTIDVEGLYDEYMNQRKVLNEALSNGDSSCLKKLSVKDLDAYDKSRTLPVQMRGTIVWNSLVPEEEILPMDRVMVVPLSFKLMQENQHIPRVKEMLRLSLIDNEKMKIDPVICLPENYDKIPDWIQIVIDKEYTIDKLLASTRQLLEMFDFYVADTKAGFIPSRLLYI